MMPGRPEVVAHWEPPAQRESLARVLLVDELRAWQECVAFGTVRPDDSMDHFRAIVDDYRAREAA